MLLADLESVSAPSSPELKIGKPHLLINLSKSLGFPSKNSISFQMFKVY